MRFCETSGGLTYKEYRRTKKTEGLRIQKIYSIAFSQCFCRIGNDSILPVYSVSQPVFEPVALRLKTRIFTALDQSCIALNWCGAVRKWPGNGLNYFLLCQRGQWFSNSHHCLVLSKPEGGSCEAEQEMMVSGRLVGDLTWIVQCLVHKGDVCSCWTLSLSVITSKNVTGRECNTFGSVFFNCSWLSCDVRKVLAYYS